MVFTLQTERKKLGEANLPLFIKAHSHEKQSIPEDQHESFLRTVPPVTPLSSTQLHLIGVGIMITKDTQMTSKNMKRRPVSIRKMTAKRDTSHVQEKQEGRKERKKGSHGHQCQILTKMRQGLEFLFCCGRKTVYTILKSCSDIC